MKNTNAAEQSPWTKRARAIGTAEDVEQIEEAAKADVPVARTIWSERFDAYRDLDQNTR